MPEYLNRIIENKLKDTLDTCGAVLIKGPKWCGKSTTALRFAKSAIFMQDTDEKEQNIELARNSAKIFLAKEPPLLIDEWQEIPFIWDAVRFQVDQRREFGQFILTGSSSPLSKSVKSQIMHSGVGRITTIYMRPMSLFESKDSTGSVSLTELFNGFQPMGEESKLGLLEYSFLICRGGWPMAVGLPREKALKIARNYFTQVIEHDLLAGTDIVRNKEKLIKTLTAYARNISSECSIQTLIDDVKSDGETTISDNTVVDYLEIFRENFIIEDITAWNPNIRSKTAIRTSPTRHFICPSIAAKALNIGPNDLINDLNTYGLMFEDLVVRDLKVYVDNLDGTIYHYRDKSGLECDAVVRLDNGKFGLVEVKLGSAMGIEDAAKSLLKLKSLLPDNKQPSFLMVITTTNLAYTRQDGVIVCPLGCLKDW